MILPDVNVLLSAFRSDSVDHARYRDWLEGVINDDPGSRHFSLFEGLCRRPAASGNLVQDAWLAALAVEHGCEWISTDGDYARFPGLRWRRPF